VYRGIGALFILVGILQLGACLVESSQALAARNWPTATATVQTAKLVEVHVGSKTQWKTQIAYSYKVKGVEYEGHRIYFDDVGGFPDELNRTISRYPAHSIVRLFYKESDPSQSLLSPGLYWYSFAWLGLSLTAMAVGGLMIVWNCVSSK
jgi:hypothetical protein